MRKGRERTDLAILGSAGMLALTVLAFSYVELVDDAYISFRYAHNLAEGQGLVFNPGDYVEGYTSLLWTLLMALPEALELPTYIFAAYLGLTFGILALVETWRICCLLGLSSWGTAAAVVALGTYPDFWTTVTMGLEGGLFAFLLASCIRLTLSGRQAWAGLLGGLMFATRPESVLLLVIFVPYAFFESRGRIRRTISLVSPWLTVVVAVTAWRLFYYSAWLPNTIVAKSPPNYDIAVLLANAEHGISYLWGFVYFAAPLVLGALVAPILAHRTPAVWLCLGAFGMAVPAILINAGDWMPNYRLLSVYAPLLGVLFGISVSRLAGHVPGRVRPAALALLVAWPVVFFSFLHSWDPAPDAHPWDPTPDAWDLTLDMNVAEAEPCWHIISEEVKPALLPSDVVAPEVLGVVSYYNSSVYVHDILGLTDRHVARHGNYIAKFGKVDIDYTHHVIQPDLVLAKHVGLLPHEEHRTYELPDLSTACGEHFTFAVREEHVPRILPALAEQNPQPIDVPEERLAAQEREKAQKEASRLREELDAERFKAFWRRLFGG